MEKREEERRYERFNKRSIIPNVGWESQEFYIALHIACMPSKKSLYVGTCSFAFQCVLAKSRYIIKNLVPYIYTPLRRPREQQREVDHNQCFCPLYLAWSSLFSRSQLLTYIPWRCIPSKRLEPHRFGPVRRSDQNLLLLPYTYIKHIIRSKKIVLFFFSFYFLSLFWIVLRSFGIISSH